MFVLSIFDFLEKLLTTLDIKKAQQRKRPTHLVLIVFILASIMTGLASHVSEFNPSVALASSL